MIITIAVSIMAITLIVLASFVIPTVIEVRKTAIAARDFFARTDTELQPVLKELREVMADLRPLTEGAASRAEDVKSFLAALGETGRNLHAVNDLVCSVSGAYSRYNVLWTGAKATGRFIIDRLKRKGG